MNRVEVYYNLHKHCLSYRYLPMGHVVHTSQIMLSRVTFSVQPAGHARVLRERRKNVHAFVRGIPEYYNEPTNPEEFIDSPVVARVRYNPDKGPWFVYRTGELSYRQIFKSPLVYIRGKEIYAITENIPWKSDHSVTIPMES